MNREAFWSAIAAARMPLHGADAADWPVPETVESYSESDFDFLSPAERTRLQQAVARFREFAEPLPAGEPPSPERMAAAAESLREILAVLPVERFGDAESFRAQTLLERSLAGRLPPWVEGLDCRTGLDHMDGPMMRIDIRLSPAATARTPDSQFAADLSDVRQAVEAAYRRIDRRGRWPYVSFLDAEVRRPDRKASA